MTMEMGEMAIQSILDQIDFWFLPQSQERDAFLLQLLLTYLNVFKRCSQASITAFTMYDYLNLKSDVAYQDWDFSEISDALCFYIQHVRPNFVTGNNLSDVSLLQPSVRDSAKRVVTTPVFVGPGLSQTFVFNDTFMIKFISGKADFPSNIPRHRPRFVLRDPPPVYSRLIFSNTNTCPKSRLDLYQHCKLQTFTGIDVIEKSKRGRAIIATRPFVAGEVIIDYHAPLMTKVEADAIMNAPPGDRRSDFLFKVKVPNRRRTLYFDGSKQCSCHPSSYLMGRLINCAFTENNRACNIQPCLFRYNDLQTVVFVARRKISVLEEIR